MKFRRMRFTVRRLMVAVAIVAIATGGLVLWRRASEFSRLARLYGAWEEFEKANFSIWSKMSGSGFRRHRESLDQDLAEMTAAASPTDVHIYQKIMQCQDRIAELKRAEVADTAEVKRSRVRAEHFGQLAGKYRDAARRPWLPVAPDPPEPE
jgi:hypothetical protein